MQQHRFTWLQESIKGNMIHESPDGGKTVKSRPSADHPIQILVRGEIPIDTWYKIYGTKNESG